MRTWSAFPLTTPAAMVPTPFSDTELDADHEARVAVLAVVNQLREVLDGVDVVVRRREMTRRRGGHAGHRDVALDLGPGQLTALAGLGALRHLDLNLVGV